MKKGKKFYIADPGKGKTTYNLEEFRRHWISTRSNDEGKGIAMFFETTPAFFTYQMEGEDRQKEKRSFKFLFRYFKKYRKAFSWTVPCSWCCRSLPNPSWMSVSRTKTLDSSGSFSWAS